MRTFLWIALVTGLTCLAAWIVLGPWVVKNPYALFLIAMFFVVPNLGTVWMLYIAVRTREAPPPVCASSFHSIYVPVVLLRACPSRETHD